MDVIWVVDVKIKTIVSDGQTQEQADLLFGDVDVSTTFKAYNFHDAARIADVFCRGIESNHLVDQADIIGIKNYG